ncbi:hypothetical protein KR032_003355, partial [Drosophila birchii]
QLPDHRVREARGVLRGEDVVLCKLNAMTNALRQIEKGFLLLIMTPPQPQSSERVDDNMSGA